MQSRILSRNGAAVTSSADSTTTGRSVAGRSCIAFPSFSRLIPARAGVPTGGFEISLASHPPAFLCVAVEQPRSMSMARTSESAGDDVKRALHKRKEGTLKSGKDGKGGKVTSRRQAIAIGLSEAREKGKKVPAPKKARRRSR